MLATKKNLGKSLGQFAGEEILDNPKNPNPIPYQRPLLGCCAWKFSITGVQNNQDLMWCEKIGVYMGFCVHHGS